jgi:trehalose 6-phosphate synthase
MPVHPLSAESRDRPQLPDGVSLAGRRFVVVSNRQPYSHVRVRNRVRVEKPPSGLTLALEPILQAVGGIWLAASSGNADREFVDERGRVLHPPAGTAYGLRRLFLPEDLREDYYAGFANSSLWPLCHYAYRRPQFEERWWQAYRRANELFADGVADEVGSEPAVVFIQDFHLALLPRMVRERCPQALVAQFWHIPWPAADVFRICPWRRELLRGLLGNDLLGFHLVHHCNNFLDTVDRELQVRVDRERNAVIAAATQTSVAAFPISVDYPRIQRSAVSLESRRRSVELRRKYAGTRRLVLSVERLDYSKGIIERLAAVQRMFERHPRLRGEVSFVQIATPSRTDVAAYRDYTREVESAIRRLNRQFGTPSWIPVQALHTYVEPERVWSWYHAADVLVVSSLHDGMNLVAKEFIASCRGGAVLLLSKFTGAARELREALQINPYARDHFADTIALALELPEADRRARMRRLRWRVSNNDIVAWAGNILRAIRQHEFEAGNSSFFVGRPDRRRVARPPAADASGTRPRARRS